LFPCGRWAFREKILAKSPFSAFEVQADGHELGKIGRQIAGIPTTGHRVVRWHGDFAKFIIANLEL
jgi:hypothetical protein